MVTLDFFIVGVMVRPRELGAKRYQFSLRVTNDLKKKLDQLADYEGITYSEVVTLLLERYVDAELEEAKRIKKGS